MRAAFLLLCMALMASAAAAADRFPIRYDNWLYYQKNTDDSGRWQYRMRFDMPIAFADDWLFTQRAYLPLVNYTNRLGPDNADGGWQAGPGDWFFDEAFTMPQTAKNTRGIFGVRFVVPTGGAGPFGSGQYQWAPFVGLSHEVPGMGLRIEPLVRYFMSFHASEAAASQVRRLDLYPTASRQLGQGWTMRTYDENPISYNQVTRKWFVPLDAQLVKRARKDLEYMFGAAYGLVRDDPQYLWQVYTRFSLYF